jgi:hypothetical protein
MFKSHGKGRLARVPGVRHQLIMVIEGVRADRADGVNICIWSVLVDRVVLRLVFDDYPQMVSLESRTDDGDVLLRRLQRVLAPQG